MRANRGNLWPRARLSGDRNPERQRHEAMVGASIRSWLAEHGSPTWEPAEDCSWREWIELQWRHLRSPLRRGAGRARAPRSC